MAAHPKTPTPSKDMDIFGKEMRLTAAEQQILGGDRDIFLRKVLHVDAHSKKGDPTEPKTLVISSSRCFILTQKGGVRLEASFNFLKIQQLYCSETKLTFHLAGDPRPREFHSEKKDSVEILGLITAQFKSVFPVTPLEMIIQMTFSPEAMKQDVLKLRDSMLSMMERVDASSIHGFITTYGFLCDFFGVTFSEEISWYLKNVYHAHGFRDLKLADFDHLSSRDLLPVMSTLRHNQFFEGVIEKDGKLVLELFEELGFILNGSKSLKKLVLNNCGMKPENMIRLSTAIKNNPKSAITYLDLSDNLLDDKAVESLGLALENLSHGLQELVLANCKITPRAGSQLAHYMKQNKNMQYSLVHFDLSGNPLGADPQGALAFIQEPQTIARLNLSKCGLSFDQVIPLLHRGCQQHLRELDLSQNAGRTKKGIHGASIGSGLQQFCSSAISIETIDLSDCKLTGEVVSAMLEGLAVNPNVQAIDLNLASNDLGVGRNSHNLAAVLSRTHCLRRIDISSCGLDSVIPDFVDAVAANKSIRHLAIGRNFNSKGNVRAAALESLAGLLSRDGTQLESLCLNESRLKEQTAIILDALAGNRSLTTLNISGNQMMNRGARCLAKALLSNCRLREVTWDHNETTLYGFQDVVNALEHNYTLRAMPLPLHDIGRMGRDAGVESAVQKIQAYLCRNHSDERVKIELAARHRRRLLTATQQSAVIGREAVQLGDLLEWAESHGHAQHEDVVTAKEIKEQANKVVQLVDSLYSTHVESEQFETVTAQVRSLMDSFMDDLYREHIQENSERMVSQCEKACPTILTDEARESLRKLVVGEMSSEYMDAKKSVAHKSAPEIINHISGINLDVAADISELIVEQTLMKLEKCNARLFKLQKKAAVSSGATLAPDQRVSKNFTFRVKGEESPRTKKRRTRKPDPEDEDEIEIPDAPLVSEGPALHHPGKSRPKPARMQRGGRGGTVKPALLAEAADETDSSKVEEGPAGGEAGDREKPKAAPLLPPKKPVEEPVKPDQPDLPPPERPPKPVTPVKEANGPVELVEPELTKESPKASPRASLTPSPQAPSPLPEVTPPTPSPEEPLPGRERSPVPGEALEPSLPSDKSASTKSPTHEATPTEEATLSKKDAKKAKKEQKQREKAEGKPRPETPDREATPNEKPKKSSKETRKEKKQQEKQEKLEVSEAGSRPGSRPETPEQEGTLREKKKTTKDRKRGGLSKIFGRSKSKDEVEEVKEVLPEQPVVEEATPPAEKPPAVEPPVAAEVKQTPEAAPVKQAPEVAPKAPPPVKTKPKRSLSTEHLLREDGGGEGSKEEGRRLPVGATAQIGQLANILKSGVSPLKPRPPVDRPAGETSDSPQQGKRPTPSPKPRGPIPHTEDGSESPQTKPSPTPRLRSSVLVSDEGQGSPQQKPSPKARVAEGKDSPQPGQKPSPGPPKPRPKPRPRKANTADLGELLKETEDSPPVERKPREDGPTEEVKPPKESPPEVKPKESPPEVKPKESPPEVKPKESPPEVKPPQETSSEDKPPRETPPKEKKPPQEIPPEDADAPPRPPPPMMDTSDEELSAPEDEVAPAKGKGESEDPLPSASDGGVPGDSALSGEGEEEEEGLGPSIISLVDDGDKRLSSEMDTLV